MKTALDILEDRPVAYHPVLAQLTGSVRAALFLSQLLYWHDKGFDPEGWIYKTHREWTAETGLTRREQEGARATLRKMNLVTEERRGQVRQIYFLLNRSELEERLNHAPVGAYPCTQKDIPMHPPVHTMHPKGHTMHPKGHTHAPKRPSDPESTTETTTENTPEKTDIDTTHINPVDQNANLWPQVLEELKRQVPKNSFDTWLRKINLYHAGSDGLLLICPTETEAAWCTKRFGPLVRKVAQRIVGHAVWVEFVPLKEANERFGLNWKDKPQPRPTHGVHSKGLVDVVRLESHTGRQRDGPG